MSKRLLVVAGSLVFVVLGAIFIIANIGRGRSDSVGTLAELNRRSSSVLFAARDFRLVYSTPKSRVPEYHFSGVRRWTSLQEIPIGSIIVLSTDEYFRELAIEFLDKLGSDDDRGKFISFYPRMNMEIWTKKVDDEFTRIELQDVAFVNLETR